MGRCSRWEGLPVGGQLSSLGLDPSEGSLGGDRKAEWGVLDPQLPTPWLQSPALNVGVPVQTQHCHCWFQKVPSARCPVRLFCSSCYPDGTMGYHAGPRTTLLRIPWPWCSSAMLLALRVLPHRQSDPSLWGKEDGAAVGAATGHSQYPHEHHTDT